MDVKNARVVLLTGMPGSGKDILVKACKNRGLRVLRMGDLVRSEAVERGLELTDENVGKLAHEMREKHGFDVWAKRILEKLENDMTVIDGVRGSDEIDLFKRELGDRAIVVAIHSSPETRFNRLVTRSREDAPGSREEFDERDWRELQWGLGNVISKADFMIVNESSLEELNSQAEAVLDEILGDR